jgi:MFS family permease
VFLRLYLGTGLVFLGVMGQGIARSWLAFQLTGSNAALGAVLLVFGGTMLLATPWGGVLADRMSKRFILQSCIALLAATSVWMGLAVAFDAVTYWMLLVISALQAVAFAFYGPARTALLTDVVAARQVSSALALLLVNNEASRVVGPAVAGLLIGSVAFGTEVVFLGCGVLFAGGLLLGAGLPPGRARRTTQQSPAWQDLLEGGRYVRRRPELTKPLVCALVVIMIGLPYLAFLPTVAADVFAAGSGGYGALSATSASGAVVAGLVYGRLQHRANPWILLAVAGALFGASLVVFGLAPTFGVAVVVLLPLGGGYLVFQTLSQSLLMALSEPAFHGRIQGLVQLGFGGFGIAALPLGVLADEVGLRATFVGMGACVLVAVLVHTVVSRRHWSHTSLRDAG